MELSRNDLLCAISRAEGQINEVEEWRKTEYQTKYEELAELHRQLDAAVTVADRYHRKIEQRLDKIARLKAVIGQHTPENNGFRFEG
jgi:uncharacterized coiled-coil DUF342 family protein